MGKMYIKKSAKSEVNEIIDLDVEYISLVDSPANAFGLVIKSGAVAGQSVISGQVPILKTDELTKTVYGIVYAPDTVDLQGDFSKADVIKKAAYNYMSAMRIKNVDTQHDFKSNGSFVAESWIVRKGDELFPDRVGAWAVGLKVDSPDIWASIKSGKINGLSLAGMSQKQPVNKGKDEDKSFVNEMKEFLKNMMSGGEPVKTEEEKKAEEAKKEAEKKEADGKSELDKLKEENAKLVVELTALKEQLATLQKSVTERKSDGVVVDGKEKVEKTHTSILGR